MAINLSAPDFTELKPRILVFGVGGAGGNAVNNMVASKLEGVEFLVANTDAQALVHSKASYRLQLGSALTQGLGAGSRPDVGEAAAEESGDEIKRQLESSHMVFITAGMGGGTGTGAAPVIAKIARDMGILTVGVVTKPFAFEGGRRMRIAEEGIEKLKGFVDTLIVIPNQNLFRIANEKTTFAKAFEMADEVLYSGVRGVTDLMVMPGLINLDFADVRTVMSEMGTAMMGMGEAEGERRAIEAAEAAISNPLLDVSSMRGARGVLINITGGMDLTLYEVDEAANKIRQEVDPDANIIVGSTFDERLNGRMRVSVVATGIATEVRQQAMPTRASASADVRRANASEAIAEPRRSSGSAPIVQQPIAASVSGSPAISHPVHTMQSEIVQSGLASDEIEFVTRDIDQRSGPLVESHIFDRDIIGAAGPDPRDRSAREPSRTRSSLPPLPPQLQPQPEKKASGFSMFGITIGATPKKPLVQRPSAPAPSSMRLTPETQSPFGAEPPRQLKTPPKKTADEVFSAVDDELEIPAFLRRQVN
ncbi:MAG: cell division protein FtsZ [Alphaproteobacteria bacterium]|nr:cell division protein FtsZ [Alphaproteobacteria bacterium]